MLYSIILPNCWYKQGFKKSALNTKNIIKLSIKTHSNEKLMPNTYVLVLSELLSKLKHQILEF